MTTNIRAWGNSQGLYIPKKLLKEAMLEVNDAVEISVEDGFSRNAEGALAGTTTMLDAGWHSLMSSGHLLETQAARAVTANPAAAFGLDDRGVLMPGRRADLAVFECETNRVLMTVRRGEIIHEQK